MLEKEVKVKVDTNDNVTGECQMIDKNYQWISSENDLKIADEAKYRRNYNPQCSGIGEVNNGPYLVDSTGYVSLADILKRCLRQGVVPAQMVEGDMTADEVMALNDDLSTDEATLNIAQSVGNVKATESAVEADSVKVSQEKSAPQNEAEVRS